MEISTLLSHIDNGHMALPEFQRGYVWNRDQVRSFFDSLYKRHPVGSLLVWATQSTNAVHRGDGQLAPGIVKLILDGQQRMTTLYGVIRGKAPKFFEGNEKAFTGLYFNLATEQFMFYSPMKMDEDPLWINVTELMKKGHDGIDELTARLYSKPELTGQSRYVGKLAKLLGIKDVSFNIEDVTGEDKTIDVVVDIFNKVNSGGTKLSKGDLALAKICAEWPDARDLMRGQIDDWKHSEYHFNLDWLLRSVNTILTGEAKFQYLHNQKAVDIENAFKKATKHIDNVLNLISGRLGLDHDRVLFGRFAIPVMVRLLDNLNGGLDETTRDKLLFWYAQAGMWGRFSGSTESYIDKDLSVIEGKENGIDNLIEQLRLWHGGLKVEPGHFSGWSLGARFYPVLYMLTRMGEAKDWGTGIPLKASLLGKMNKLEVHHIFPKAQLYKYGYSRAEVNALANFCFLTKDTNLKISDRLPEIYFEEVESSHPGALSSQWIPMNEDLWKIENYRLFLQERQKLLAEETNKKMEELLHGDTKWLSGSTVQPPQKIYGGISSDDEEKELEELASWVEEQNLTPGEIAYDYSNPETGQQEAIFDLAWPNGIQEELSEPVAVLLNEGAETLAIANNAGFRCYTSVDDFKRYIEKEILRKDKQLMLY
ncbi:DUF262 domain-containing protein [uncultured Draconibacterium sp.]|uniref:GmrSD restriction endonuclease domain-containing protein n=1 Tax=uncultured Draconibacterium sp. TaxID=1573823 RepID=UPI0025FDF2B9|nr:DUF262 domain-containing protein [uncultured Draconibacterium sp.]